MELCFSIQQCCTREVQGCVNDSNEEKNKNIGPSTLCRKLFLGFSNATNGLIT